MLLSLLCALAAAVAFGVAAVLQGIGTRRTAATSGLDPRLLLRLLRQPVFAASLMLNLVGFALHAIALAALPLFLVQAIISSSVAVTALLAVRVFGVQFSHQQWTAVLGVFVGLAVLAGTAATGTALTSSTLLRPAVLVTVLLVAAAGAIVARTGGALQGAGLGLLGGVAYGMVAVSARLLGNTAWSDLPTDPASYLLLLSGAVAYLLYSTAMQRGSVTTTTATLVVTQTAVPSVVGIIWLGDRVQAGLEPLAVLGFLLALGAALALARFEQVGSAP